MAGEEILWFLGGAVVGGVVVFLVAAQRLRGERALAGERQAQAERLLEEQRQFIERSRKELEDTFKALAASALAGSSEQFLRLAEQRLATTHSQAAADGEARKKAIETLVAPLREQLGKIEVRSVEIEKARESAYARIDEQVKALATATETLSKGTQTLSTALRSSQVRGRWGELALRNVAELAGMSEHCDFALQETTDAGGRPDMTVRLPGGRLIAVDAKAPLAAFLTASEATTDEARERALDGHVAALRGHVRQLAARDYSASLGGGVDLVVLFLPGDPFLAAAFSRDPDLQVEALQKKVLIATPTTLVALLRTVAIYHQQELIARNAAEIAAAARELYDRGAKFGEEMAKVGRGLELAVKAYNTAVGSFDSRFLPMGRRLVELRVAEPTTRTIDPLPAVEVAPRELRG